MRNLLINKTTYGNRGFSFQDLTGKKYGMLTAIKLHSVGKSGTKWILQCDCGNKVIRLAENFKKKQHKHSCGCISKNPGKKDAGLKRFYNDYRASAKRRGYAFNLSKKSFYSIVSSNCYFCDKEPVIRYEKQIAHKIFVNGIDRLDNSKGYTLTNCVPCCKICNRAKGSMSVKDFFNWILKVRAKYV